MLLILNVIVVKRNFMRQHFARDFSQKSLTRGIFTLEKIICAQLLEINLSANYVA